MGDGNPPLVGQCASMTNPNNLLGKGKLGSPFRSAYDPDPHQRFNDLKVFEDHLQQYVENVRGQTQPIKASFIGLVVAVFVVLVGLVWLVDPFGEGRASVFLFVVKHYLLSLALAGLSFAVASALSPDAHFTHAHAVEKLRNVLGVYNLSCDTDGSLIVPGDLQRPRTASSSSSSTSFSHEASQGMRRRLQNEQ